MLFASWAFRASKFYEHNQQCHVWHLCPSRRSGAMTRHPSQDGKPLFLRCSATGKQQFPVAILCNLSARGFRVGMNTLAWLLLHKKVMRAPAGVRGIGVCCRKKRRKTPRQTNATSQNNLWYYTQSNLFLAAIFSAVHVCLFVFAVLSFHSTEYGDSIWMKNANIGGEEKKDLF